MYVCVQVLYWTVKRQHGYKYMQYSMVSSAIWKKTCTCEFFKDNQNCIWNSILIGILFVLDSKIYTCIITQKITTKSDYKKMRRTSAERVQAEIVMQKV